MRLDTTPCDDLTCAACRPPRGCLTCGALPGQACFQHLDRYITHMSPAVDGFEPRIVDPCHRVPGIVHARVRCIRGLRKRREPGRTPEFMPGDGPSLSAQEMVVNLQQLLDAASDETEGDRALIVYGFGLAVEALDTRRVTRGELRKLARQLAALLAACCCALAPDHVIGAAVGGIVACAVGCEEVAS